MNIKKCKLNKSLIIAIIGVFFLMSSGFSFANENSNEIIINANKYSTKELLEKNLMEALSDPNIDEVKVINIENEEIYENNISQEEIAEIMPQTTSSVYYQVKNVRKSSDYTGKSDIAIATGQPGVTVSISKSKSVSTTLSATLGATYSKISAAVGWNVTGSTSISIKGSAKVPSKHNNKNVKTMTLHAKAIYKVKKFDVYRYVPGYTNTKIGTANTKKAYGVSFTKTYTYK